MHNPLPRLKWGHLDELLTVVRPQRKRYRFALLVLAALLLAAVWWFVWITGGSRGPYTHAAYLPILLTGATIGIDAAVGTAVLATLLLGPLMPLDVAADVPQRASAWLSRGAFLVVIGAFVGAAFQVVHARIAKIEELRTGLAATHSRSLRVFAGLVAKRDEQTYGHCERVGRNAVAIGRRLGLDARELGRLYWAGLLHDLGKIGVPEAILRKPGKLTDDEFREMQQHCEFGRTILLNVSADFEPIAEGLLSHHERWDGTGYPHGLAGTDIPLFGRILAVADVFEALTSQRPYREPMTRDEALAELTHGRGHHFDPSVHHAFLAALEDGDIGLEMEEGSLAMEEFVQAVLQPDLIGMDLADREAPWRARA